MRAPASPIEIKLYITGRTPAAERAVATIRALESKFGPRVCVKIIDVLENPLAALNDDVYLTPAVYRVAPAPMRRMFGRLESVELVIEGLELTALKAAQHAKTL